MFMPQVSTVLTLSFIFHENLLLLVDILAFMVVMALVHLDNLITNNVNTPCEQTNVQSVK